MKKYNSQSDSQHSSRRHDGKSRDGINRGGNNRSEKNCGGKFSPGKPGRAPQDRSRFDRSRSDKPGLDRSDLNDRRKRPARHRDEPENDGRHGTKDARFAHARMPRDKPEKVERLGDWGFEEETRSKKSMVRREGYDVVVLGAGAAGLLCAAELVNFGLSVCVLDRSRTPGRKLAIAGGGHANVTNEDVRPSHYLCQAQNFVEPVLEQVKNSDIIRMVERLGLSVETREKGKIFLRETGADMARALIARCRKGQFTLLMGEHLDEKSLRYPKVLPDGGIDEKAGGNLKGLRVKSEAFEIPARRAVVALGSPACPATGASGLGYALAQRLGHNLIPPKAALTPLALPEDSPFLKLSGVSLPVKVSVEPKETAGNNGARRGPMTISDDMLFTAAGLSGPAILKISLGWQEGETLVIDFLPREVKPLFGDNNGRRTPRSVLASLMPQRLVDTLLPKELANRKCAELGRAQRDRLEALVHGLELVPAARGGLRRAEVCSGGVDCSEIEPLTFKSRKMEKIAIIGETLDVTGLLGGYNLHWAFASALLCARHMARELAAER